MKKRYLLLPVKPEHLVDILNGDIITIKAHSQWLMYTL